MYDMPRSTLSNRDSDNAPLTTDYCHLCQFTESQITP